MDGIWWPDFGAWPNADLYGQAKELSDRVSAKRNTPSDEPSVSPAPVPRR